MIPMILLSVGKIFVIALAILFLALYMYFRKQYKYWESKNVPCAKPVFPFGNLTGIKDNAASVIFQKIYEESKYQRYYGLWLFYKPALMVNDPDLIKRILVENFTDFHCNGSSFDNGNDKLFTETLFSLEGSKWKNLRAKISPIFSSRKLKAIFPLMVKCGRDLQDVLEDPAKMNDVIDSKEISSRFIMDAISCTAFGIEINQIRNPDNEIGKMMSKVFQPSIVHKLKLFFAIFIPRFARMLKMSLNSKEVQDFFVGIFRDIVDSREKNNYSRNDVMQLLIELLRKGYIDDANRTEGVEVNKHEFTFENLVSQAMMFLLTGYETTTRTMQFALYELAMNQEIQTELRHEIKTVLGRYNGETTHESVGEMEYLGRVVNETLRKYPTGGALMRQCRKEFKDPCSDLIIDKNTTILISLFGLHRDERYYLNPEKFDPDRFTEENKSSRSNYTYLPFGEGPRSCVGQRLALLEIKIGLIAILSKFRLKTSDRFTPKTIELDPKSLIPAPKGKIMLEISIADQ